MICVDCENALRQGDRMISCVIECIYFICLRAKSYINFVRYDFRISLGCANTYDSTTFFFLFIIFNFIYRRPIWFRKYGKNDEYDVKCWALRHISPVTIYTIRCVFIIYFSSFLSLSCVLLLSFFLYYYVNGRHMSFG